MAFSVRLWGTRGSIATPGPETQRYGGNTSCVEVRAADGTILVLDAGTGIRRLGESIAAPVRRVDILLTHLHMDHIQGLGFFSPLFDPEIEVHIYGPASTTLSLRDRLGRYLSPPLFPVHLRDLLSTLHLHEVPSTDFHIGPFRVTSQLVCHPNPTVGYRISDAEVSLTYLPDHEPALGLRNGWLSGEWTSGFALACNTDLLIHDAQYRDDEYDTKVGWGHSSMRQAVGFAGLVHARHLVLFHHDPSHHDDEMDRLVELTVGGSHANLQVTPGTEGSTFFL